MRGCIFLMSTVFLVILSGGDFTVSSYKEGRHKSEAREFLKGIYLHNSTVETNIPPVR